MSQTTSQTCAYEYTVRRGDSFYLIAAGPVAESRIEIELAGGHRMRISGSYDPEALARLIRELTA